MVGYKIRPGLGGDRWVFQHNIDSAHFGACGREDNPQHTYALRLPDKGLTITDVQRGLGGSHLSTSLIYLHVSPAGPRQRIQGEAGKERAQLVAELRRQLQELQRQIAALEGS